MPAAIFRLPFAALLLLSAAFLSFPQDPTKRNDRQPQPSPTPQRREENKKPPDPTAYSYEFTQPKFLISRILIEHDALGRGKITFVRQSETPIVEPIELSTGALGRIFGLWNDLHFLDSNENYQTTKDFSYLGVYRLHMDDGQRRRTAEFNWSDNKPAWALVKEYQRVSDQAVFVFDMTVARENQPLNAPSLMNQLESMYTRGGLSDPHQLVPLLTELRTDERIPLIARNHADRLLKKIEK
ncbi:MAG TPA: hypothetical protein VHD88_04890 [Pyrinomonadaceae bacterium]|nr:hypothetical protein [Pyrinomonadaceae bacterium]